MINTVIIWLLAIFSPSYAIKPKELISGFLESWKRSDVIDLPGLDIPDPYTEMPDFKASGFEFTQNTIHGLSKVQIVSFKIEQDANDTFQASAKLLLPEFYLRGYYNGSLWWNVYEGNYTATIRGIEAYSMVVPIVDEFGSLQLEKIQPDLIYDDMNIQLGGDKGFFGSALQALTNTLNSVVFNFVKPTLIGSVNDKIIPPINEWLSTKVQIRFPNSVNLLDSFLANDRTRLLPSKLKLNDETVGGTVKVHFTNGYVEGLRTLHRAGPMNIMLINHTFHLLLEAEVGYLSGGFHWSIPIWITEYTGEMWFTVKGFRILVDLSQSANVEKHASLDDLKIYIDQVIVKVDGMGYADYLLEFAVNVLPNLLKESLYSRMNGPIRSMINLYLQEHPMERFISVHLE